MAKKNKGKIKTTPKSTADKVAGRDDLRKWDEYQQALGAGRGNVFLKKHSKFAKNAGLKVRKNPASRYKDDLKMNTQKLAAAEPGIVQQQGTQAGTLQNLGNVQNDFGSASQYWDGTKWVQKQESSQNQKDILAGGEGLSIQGQSLAAGNLDNYQQFGYQATPEERARIEQEVYGRLTRNVDRDQQQEFEQMEQRMYNRGIPLDPSNPAYKRELDAINEKYAAIKEDASAQAVQMGGQEMQRDFGMNLSSQQQKMAETAALQGMGTGYQGAPQLDFQGPQLHQSNMTDVALQRQGNDLQRYGIDKGYAASVYGADKAAATAAANRAQNETDNIPT